MGGIVERQTCSNLTTGRPAAENVTPFSNRSAAVSAGQNAGLRELQQHFRAPAARSRPDGHRRSVELRDLVDYREPQSAAVSRGIGQSVEPLPHPLTLLLRDAGAIVFHGQVR